MAETVDETRGWWEAHRLHYNLGLLAAGAIAYGLDGTIIEACTEWHLPEGTIEAPEFTLFWMPFHLVGFAIVVALANVAYLLGPAVERLLRPADAKTYRRVAFGLGFAFSVSLPLAVPAMTFAQCSGHLSLDPLEPHGQVVGRSPY